MAEPLIGERVIFAGQAIMVIGLALGLAGLGLALMLGRDEMAKWGLVAGVGGVVLGMAVLVGGFVVQARFGDELDEDCDGF